MNNDPNFLERFEHGLNPADLSASKIPGTVLGYGEISTIFQISNDDQRAYKRMPLFKTVAAAEEYAANYRHYCDYLGGAGLTLPDDNLQIVALPKRPVVLYIVQQQFSSTWFAHRLIHVLDADANKILLTRIAQEAIKIRTYNQTQTPALEIALDAQISNWVFENGDPASGTLYYIDTSTPLYRLDGVEQLNPELILQSAPSFLRWLISKLFLNDVMNRYYDQRQIMIDLAANLYKEQLPQLIPIAIIIINSLRGDESTEITAEIVNGYYREDKFIWALFLAARKIDRWLTTTLLRKRYEFILPGRIQR
ncbi:MAG: DUF6206 family protein [Candidatus Neomarinimicrobiota bacterium]